MSDLNTIQYFIEYISREICPRNNILNHEDREDFDDAILEYEQFLSVDKSIKGEELAKYERTLVEHNIINYVSMIENHNKNINALLVWEVKDEKFIPVLKLCMEQAFKIRENLETALLELKRKLEQITPENCWNAKDEFLSEQISELSECMNSWQEFDKTWMSDLREEIKGLG